VSTQADLQLQLLLTLNDQVSAGMRRMMKDMQDGAGATARSMQDIDRAAKSLGNNQMTGLRDAMRQLAREARSVLDVVTKIGAGVAAGGYAVGRMAAAPMAYDARLALMANTAFSGRDAAGRIQGKAELDAAIQAAVRMGGGTRESAAETLDKLLASGAIGATSAGKLLPTLLRASTATGASAGDLADIAIRAKQTFGLTDDQLPLALDKAIVAGQRGGFELRDMARWLPQQMAAARLSGLNGMGGLEKLLAYNQASAITAGSKDEAGNNLVNLLAKINSRDTAVDAEKYGIDLSGTLAGARAKGVSSLEAFIGIADEIAAGDARYLKLREQAAGQSGGERQATLAAMGDILQGSAIGKIIQDRQALMALVGAMNNRQYIAGVEQAMRGAGGETSRSFGVVADTTSFKVGQLKTEKDIAAQRVFDAAAPNGLIAGVTKAAQEFPNLTTAVVGATGALIALAAAAGASGLAGVLTGGAAGKAGGKIATTAAGAALKKAAPAAIASAGMGPVLAPVAATVGLAAVGVGEWNEGLDKLNAVGSGAARERAAREARRAELEARLLKLAGRDELEKTRFYDLAKLEKTLADLEKRLAQPQKITVDVKNGNITAEVNKTNAREAKRH
jgi:hypothetical protein